MLVSRGFLNQKSRQTRMLLEIFLFFFEKVSNVMFFIGWPDFCLIFFVIDHEIGWIFDNSCDTKQRNVKKNNSTSRIWRK